MLRIIQNRSAESAKSYYSRAEYYGESQEKGGVWHGKTAKMLGLTGAVEKHDFDALCDNKDPRSGEQLTARHNHDRTVGYDFNWHVPKGLSLAYAIGGDQRIEDVFSRAVEETMLEIEREAATRVRTDGQQRNRTTGNLAWASFVHTTTRPDENGYVDPHLHIHSFVFNSTFDPDEERFKAAQFRELKRSAPFWEVRMHARLAKAVRGLGYSIKRDGRHWDIAGLPENTKRKFSRRTLEIEKLAEKERITDPEQKSALGAKTRNSKSNDHSFSELQAEWNERLTPTEKDLFQGLLGPGVGDVNGPETVKDAVASAVNHCFERDSVVPERQLLTEALRFGVGTIDVNEVNAAVSEQGVLTREVNGQRLATTREVLQDEAKVLEFARSGKHSVTPLNADWTLSESWLSDEQVNAIESLVKSDDRLQMILGGAGTGKTTLMQQAAAAIEAGGHQVFAFAPSAEASRKVLREEGFDTATTVAELLVNKELQRETAGQVIWIDEAGLLGGRQLSRVTDLAEQNGARLILSGDWHQHSSVERGDVMRIIDRYTPVSPIQIKTIRRQDGAYKEAVSAISTGQVLNGFDRLSDLGWVHELDDDARYKQLASDYADVVAKKQSALVVSPTHKEAETVVQAIRDELKNRGVISGKEHTINVLKPRHLTEGQRQDVAWLNPADVLIFHQNAKGIRKGTRITVDETLPSDIVQHASKYSVYRPEKLALARGDQIRITSGGKTQDGNHRLNNGAVFEVRKIDRNGNITLKNGWVIDKDFGHIAQGFVSTSHSSQGKTVDHVFIAQSEISEAAADAKQFYVSASRGRKSARVFTDSRERLREVIAETQIEASATEVFEPVTQIERHQRQHKAATREHTPPRAPQPELIHAR